MGTAVNEPLEQVLAHYPFKVLEFRNESYKDKKGVWWVRTTDGMKILKKISNSEETLRYILHAVHHLQHNGIRLPEVIRTSAGGDYVNLGGTCYVLSEAVEGKNPSYSNASELNSVICELARFHKASAGFVPPDGSKPKYHLGLWVEDYREQLEEINTYYKEQQAIKTPGIIGRTVMKEFPYFYERGCKAIEGLKGPEYAEWVKRAGATGSLCHQDFAAGNLIMDASGSICVIDTDSITIDIPARDLRKLLNKVMKKAGKWDAELTKRMLASYQSVNPLTRSQWQVVKLDLLFPHLFLGAVNKYIYLRDKEWTEDKYHQRISEMATFERTAGPVLDRFESLLPV